MPESEQESRLAAIEGARASGKTIKINFSAIPETSERMGVANSLIMAFPAGSHHSIRKAALDGKPMKIDFGKLRRLTDPSFMGPPPKESFEAPASATPSAIPSPIPPEQFTRISAITGRPIAKEPPGYWTQTGMNLALETNDVLNGLTYLTGKAITGTAKAVGGTAEDLAMSVIPLLINPLIDTPQAIPIFDRAIRTLDAIYDFPDKALRFGKAVGTQIVQDFKDFSNDPKTTLRDKPLTTIANLSLLWSAVGMGTRLAGKGVQIAGRAIASTEAIPVSLRAASGKAATKMRQFLDAGKPELFAGRVAMENNYSKNPLTKWILQKPLDLVAEEMPAIKAIFDYIPGIPNSLVSEDRLLSRAARQFERTRRREFFSERAKVLSEISDDFAELTEPEKLIFAKILEGRMDLSKIGFTPSPQFEKAIENSRRMAREGAELFHLPHAVVDARAWQPRIIASGRVGISDYKAADQGSKAAQRRILKAISEEKAVAAKEMRKAVKKFGKMGDDEMVDFLSFIGTEPSYFPHVFEQKIRFSNFLPTSFRERISPQKLSSLKKSLGVEGYLEDPVRVLSIHEAEKLKYLNFQKYISEVKGKFALPLKSKNDLKPGWVPFTPDGYLRFYRGKIDFQDKFLQSLERAASLDDSFVEAAQKVFPKIADDLQSAMTKTYMGVSKGEILQVPAAVAEEFAGATAYLSFGPKGTAWMRLLWDAPLDAFRFGVLSLSPKWVLNNTVGNTWLTTLAGMSPISMARAASKEFRDIVPNELLQGGFRRVEQRGQGALGSAIRTPQGRIAAQAAGFLTGDIEAEGALKGLQYIVSAPVKAIRGIGRTIFETNSTIEDQFRSALFIDTITKEAVKKSVKEAGLSWHGIEKGISGLVGFNLGVGEFSGKQLAETTKRFMAQDPKMIARATARTNKWLFDYSDLSPIERQFVRRAIPFWNWIKNITALSLKLPIENPARFKLLQSAAEAGLDASDKELLAVGVDPGLIPEYRRGSIVLKKDPKTDVVKVQTFRGANPFSTIENIIPGLGRFNPGYGPHINLAANQLLGIDPFSRQPARTSETIEVGGYNYRRNPITGEIERMEDAPRPPIMSSVIRSFVPLAVEAERFMLGAEPSRSSSFLEPELVERGPGIPVMRPAGERVSALFETPIGEISPQMIQSERERRRQALIGLTRQQVEAARAVRQATQEAQPAP